MTKIIRKYGCDGCAKLFDTLEELRRVDVQVLVHGYNRGDVEFTTQQRLYCPKCLDERTHDKWPRNYL